MAVIVIGSAEIESDIIKKIANNLGTSSGEVIRALERLLPSSKPHIVDNDVIFLPPGCYDIAFKMPEPIKFPCYTGGYSYHPNHGESCDHLWINPSVIHDQLSILSGYVRTFFHRKCFMQLKCFVNLRFAR